VASELFDNKYNIKGYSDPIWKQISDSLNGKISSSSLYINVYQDRHSWQTILRQKCSYPLVTVPNTVDEYDSSSTSSKTDDESDVKNIFKFYIPYRDFQTKKCKKNIYSFETRNMDKYN